MKQAVVAAVLIGLLICVGYVYQKPLVQWAEQKLKSPSSPAVAADVAPGKVGAPKVPTATPTASAAAAAAAVAAAERQDIEGSLRALHLTTIMPGQPGQVIIDKQDYSEGESLPLPKGRKAKIVAVQDDGVQLTCNNMAFHLDAPAEPDLAALRKKK